MRLLTFLDIITKVCIKLNQHEKVISFHEETNESVCLFLSSYLISNKLNLVNLS